MKTAVLLIGHGSRAVAANNALLTIAEMVKAQTRCPIIEVAFREQPGGAIQSGIDVCVAKGAARILLYPYFLYSGAHVLVDLPKEIEAAMQRHPGVEMVLGQPLGVHPKLAEIVCERIDSALAEAGWDQ